MSVTDDTGSVVQEISAEEGRRLLDEAAREHLNMSAEEFIAAWDSGKFVDKDSREVHEVAVLLPFGR